MLLRDPWVALSAQQKRADAQEDEMDSQGNRTRAAMFRQQKGPLQLRVDARATGHWSRRRLTGPQSLLDFPTSLQPLTKIVKGRGGYCLGGLQVDGADGVGMVLAATMLFWRVSFSTT